jgi:integrase
MLNAAKLQALKPRPALYRVADAHGLAIEVAPSGSMLWRLRYRFAGKATMIGLGGYPAVSLADARAKRDALRALLRDGLNPAAERRTAREAAKTAAAHSFEGVAREWLDTHGRKLAPATRRKALWMLEAFVFPKIGRRPVAAITSAEVLALLRPIEAAGKIETAHRTRARVAQVFRYAIATGRAESDPVGATLGALPAPVRRHRAAVTEPAQVGALLRAVAGYNGQPTTRAALQLSALTFVRPGELRAARWSEFDFDAAEWRIPAERMKMRAEHVVPLAPQAVAILRELQPLTGRGQFVFPSLRHGRRCMSINTVNAALRALGFDQHTMTAHGFRAMASTRLNELGFKPDVIERQLAHVERNKVRAAYNRAAYMDERRRMMTAWADYLDALQSGADVVAIRKASGSRR